MEARGDRRKFISDGVRLLAGAALLSRIDQSTLAHAASFATPANQDSNFLRREGASFHDNSGEVLLNGVNRFNVAAPRENQCGGFTSDELPQWFSELPGSKINVVRHWLLPGQTANGTDFARFDEILALAQTNGVRVMPVLENHWDHCGGERKDGEWYKSGYKLSFMPYVASVASRYRDNPNIAAWQIINEPEADYSALLAFTAETSAQFKSADPNHLVSLGVIGSGQKGAQQEQYAALHAIPTIDMGTYHDHGKESEAIPGDEWNGLQARVKQMKALGKPLILDEVGIEIGKTLSDGRTIDRDLRAHLMTAKMTAAKDLGVKGLLIWSYRDRAGMDDKYGFDPSDPLSNAMREGAFAR